MSDPVELLTINWLEGNSGRQAYENLVAMKAKINETITLWNAQVAAGESTGDLLANIQAEIAALEDYLNNYDGVASVNGQAGNVVLTAPQVGALAEDGQADDSARLGGVPAYNFYHTENKPSKADVGLDKVPNDNPIAVSMDPGTSNITRTAKITYLFRLSTDAVTWTLQAAGFSNGDQVFVCNCAISENLLTIVTSSGVIKIATTGTTSASQTLGKVGTVCLTKTSAGWTARAA